jgi:hypothetical protein
MLWFSSAYYLLDGEENLIQMLPPDSESGEQQIPSRSNDRDANNARCVPRPSNCDGKGKSAGLRSG